MGQLVTVVEKRSHRPGIVRFEVNRPLSGMGHERYRADQPIERDRPVDEVARRLIARGGIDAVHINGSIITVDLAKGGDAEGLAAIIRDLFRYYHEAGAPGQEPRIDDTAGAPADDVATTPEPSADAGAGAAPNVTEPAQETSA